MTPIKVGSGWDSQGNCQISIVGPTPSISMMRLVEATKRAWYKWLCRRSQRKRLNWERFTDLLRWWPLPRPRITVQIWDG